MIVQPGAFACCASAPQAAGTGAGEASLAGAHMAFFASIAGITDLGGGTGTASGGIVFTGGITAVGDGIAGGIAAVGAGAAGAVTTAGACGGCPGFITAGLNQIIDAVQRHKHAKNNYNCFGLFSVNHQIVKSGDHHNYREHNIHSGTKRHSSTLSENCVRNELQCKQHKGSKGMMNGIDDFLHRRHLFL